MSIDEGYIKFNLDWKNTSFNFKNEDFESLNSIRNQLFKLNLIGAYPNGIGFGNLSIRHSNSEFIISGSATGNIKTLTKKEYALVQGYSFKKNTVRCIGSTKASSESLSHAVIFENNLSINAVIHVHHKKMWDYYLNKLPTTNKSISYGTPEMASEIKKLSNNKDGIIIMGGHPEGIITFGKTLEEAKNILLLHFEKIL